MSLEPQERFLATRRYTDRFYVETCLVLVERLIFEIYFNSTEDVPPLAGFHRLYDSVYKKVVGAPSDFEVLDCRFPERGCSEENGCIRITRLDSFDAKAAWLDSTLEAIASVASEIDAQLLRSLALQLRKLLKDPPCTSSSSSSVSSPVSPRYRAKKLKSAAVR